MRTGACLSCWHRTRLAEHVGLRNDPFVLLLCVVDGLVWVTDGQVLEGLQVPPCGEPYHHREAEGRADTVAGRCANRLVKVRYSGTQTLGSF